MASEADDIIRYRKGEMTPAEMHAFEKKAAGDPFLEDALEGAESVSAKELETDTALLREKIRSRSYRYKTAIYWSVRIAAAVTLIAAATFIIRDYRDDPAPAKELTDASPPASQPGEPELLIALGEEPESGEEVSGPSTKPEEEEQAKPKDGLRESTETEKKESESHTDLILSEAEESQSKESRTDETHPSRKAESLGPIIALHDSAVTQPLGRAATRSEQEKSAGIEKSELREATVSGRVVNEKGEPLSGANVRESEGRLGTVADQDGRFQVTVPSMPGTLSVHVIGFEPKEISTAVTSQDVVLKEDDAAPTELNVVGAGTDSRRKSAGTLRPLVYPEPAGGRKAFDQYLQTNVRYPEAARSRRVEGRAIVEFTVDAAGTPGAFRVVKGIGSGCEEELIRLVREGPGWLPAERNGQPVPVTVRVSFRFVLPPR